MRIHSEDSSANDAVESGGNGDPNSSPNIEDRSRKGGILHFIPSHNYTRKLFI